MLQNHKDFKAFKIINWLNYNHSIHGKGGLGDDASYDDEDEDGNADGGIEVANNYMRAPRQAIIKNRRSNLVRLKSEEEIREDYSKKDREKIDATIMGIDASVTAWLN